MINGYVRFFLLAFCIAGSVTHAAELTKLSEATYQEYAPAGKEADAIYGDYVLRNDHFTAVVAQEGALRNANMMMRGIGGGLIDLTTRADQSDQLQAYLPWMPNAFVVLDGFEVDGQIVPANNLGETILRGSVIAIRFHVTRGAHDLFRYRDAPETIVRYEVSDVPFITIETQYINRSDEGQTFTATDYVRMDYGSDGKSVAKASNGMRDKFWLYEQYFGQAYAILPQNGRVFAHTEDGNRQPSLLTFVTSEDTREITLQPGQSQTIRRSIVPGRTLMETLHTMQPPDNVGRLTVRVRDENGNALPHALVTPGDARDDVGWGFTDRDGNVAASLPKGAYQFEVSSLGSGSSTITVNLNDHMETTVSLPAPGVVAAHIVNEDGGPTPCKVQFNAKEGESPFFGPAIGEFGVHNVRYSENGRFKQALEPGSYDVVISYGPEYDAVFTSIDIRQGQETPLKATLHRTVDTTGWISTDYHSHSSPSGDNTSSQLGRVLNLLAEHIEFAPCTEHNRLDSYVPHLRRLGVEHAMATCTGIELTSQPGGLNHQNAFPLLPRYGLQDNGAPLPALSPDVQIARLALWDDNSDKLVQQNHPDMHTMFFDKNRDGEADSGWEGMFGFMDVIEIHPLEAIFLHPLTDRMPEGDKSEEELHSRMVTWLQLWNLGRGVPGVVNTDAHYNFHGSGFRRNYVKSPTDEPAAINTIDVVRASESGRILMTNGPFMTVEARAGNDVADIGDTLTAPNGEVMLTVRIQCANWLDVDRVDVVINGRNAAQHHFTRTAHPDLFSDDTIRFNQTIELQLDEDAHIIVRTMGENSTLGPVMGPDKGNLHPVAISNPIFVDVDGGGFKGNGDLLDLPRVPALDN